MTASADLLVPPRPVATPTDTAPTDTAPTDTARTDTAPTGSAEMALAPGVTATSPLPPVVEVVAWSDPTFEERGHDPRSAYVERFWLGLLGPSTTWLLRRLARGLDECPDGFRIDLAETGVALGLGDSVARTSTTHRSVVRACQFGAAYRVSLGRLAVRTALPTLTRRQLLRLPEPVQRSHDRWVRGDVGAIEAERAAAIAATLRSLREPAGEVERILRSYGFPNMAARDAAREAFGW